MKNLTDQDIADMIGAEYAPDTPDVRRAVRAELHLSRRVPPAPRPAPSHMVIDFHGKTEEQAWDALMQMAKSGARTATVITGASGILHEKFPMWANTSIFAKYVQSYHPLNNGSFWVNLRQAKPDLAN